jgi:hypothetical protein
MVSSDSTKWGTPVGTLGRGVALTVGVSLILIVGAISTSNASTPRHRPSIRHKRSTEMSSVFQTYDFIKSAFGPQAKSDLIAIAGDPTDSGLWYWTESLSKVTLSHENTSSGTQQTWNIGNPVTLGIETALAGSLVVSNDDVWLAANDTLVDFRISSGSVSAYRIPVPASNAAAASFEPPEMRQDVPVAAIAATGGGEVAIALTDASSLEIFSSTSGTFTSEALPPDLTANDVAFNNAGELAVSTNDYTTHRFDTVLLAQNPTTFQRISAGSEFVTADARNFVTGDADLDIVSPGGGVTALSGSSTDGLLVGRKAVVAPDGWIVSEAQSGLAVSNPVTGRTEIEPLGTTSCGGDAGSVPGKTNVIPAADSPQAEAGSANSVCSVEATHLTVDGDGDIWSTTDTGQLVSQSGM